MSNNSSGRRGPMVIPPPQDQLRTVLDKSVAALRDQSVAQFRWLGAERAGQLLRLPVMDAVFLVDTNMGAVCREDRAKVRSTWQILMLHYLALRTRPLVELPAVTFASLPAAKTYASVYEKRVNGRLCATVGQDADRLRAAAAAIAAQPVDGGDVAFEVNVLPRLRVRLIWYAGDQEFGPACTLLLPASIESFLPIEDIVVLSESFVSRLSGQPF